MNRILVAGLGLSAAAFIGLVTHEGYTDRAVVPVPGDVPTIGFGTTQGVKIGDRITPVDALKRAERDIQKFEGALKKCVVVPLHQWEYDAFVSFAYNVGESAFCNSTLARRLNTGDYIGACNEMRKWVFVKGVRIQGLVNRREQERRLCLGPDGLAQGGK